MAKRISFSDLVTKIQSGDLTQEEAGKYFAYDGTKSKAFNPGIAINENNVDIAGVAKVAKLAAHELGIEASKVANENHVANLKNAPKPDGTIIAEGDSWFHLPSWYQKTMIDWLQESYPITNIAHQGDSLEDVVNSGEYLKYLATGKVRVLMFSAGGDDFLGDKFGSCLNLFDPDHTDPKQAAYYLTPTFGQILKRCDQLYRHLSKQVHSTSPKTRVVVHGYDRANPWCNGIFIGKHMAEGSLEPCGRPELCEAIVHLMIDRFNAVLKNLAVFLPNFIYVDLRGTLAKDDFFDELHPKSIKAKLIAAKMAPHLSPNG